MIEKLKDARVLVVGDVMLDRYIRGEVTRLSPEAPVPILENVSETYALGGAGNVVANLAALGVGVEFIAVVGRDDEGRCVRQLLETTQGVEFQLLAPGNVRTTVKTRYMVGNHQLLRVDYESDIPAKDDTPARVCDAAMQWADQNHVPVMVISDYGKGAISDGISHLIDEAIVESGCRVVVDPKGVDFRRYNGAYLVTPNLKELAETGWPVGTNDEIELAARAVLGCNIENVLVTRGADGMTLVTEDAVEHLPVLSLEAFDVTGAGDTVVAVVAAALAAGESLHDAARLANLAAGIVVGKSGTAVVTLEEFFCAQHAAAEIKRVNDSERDYNRRQQKREEGERC